jgi:hypothetical protein
MDVAGEDTARRIYARRKSSFTRRNIETPVSASKDGFVSLETCLHSIHRHKRGPSSRLHGGLGMTQDRTMDWQELCKKAANELDPAKLMQVVAELTKALDERNNKRSNGLDRGDDKDPGERSLQSAF